LAESIIVSNILQESYSLNMTYHLTKIEKGQLGDFSKIKEEFLECEDAFKQENPIMLLVELSDLLGAIEHFLTKHHDSITMKDLLEMTKATNRAFNSGHRK
jgi:hypothetical protein